MILGFVVVMHAHNGCGEEVAHVATSVELRVPKHDNDLVKLQVPRLQGDTQRAGLPVNPVVVQDIGEICVGFVGI